MAPGVEEYGIPILITDTLHGRVVNENGIVRGEGRATTRIFEEGLGQVFQAQNCVAFVKELPRSELYFRAVVLTQDIVGRSTPTEQVLCNAFGIALDHGGPDHNPIRYVTELTEEFPKVLSSEYGLGPDYGGVLVA